ncbi:hypothetical protein Pmar_PMAR022109 [Perkinsus marinus ATCC 50983]|uniref:Uncharacterized protein n=1 Tax=Perkinsus marinus (strain ATCC 50983 / TXsc) TaxID=423536 RepID=C5L6R9_PERM5|nr:hypothetical protein Pmar_PMAR022109 [Perkinsus marinus ATCC 50983]EER07572.1 hypothetical protein Pmar_PMAR022109 [Perkinsus marinus ATCC 50983]|eukprot:XP_002775756.1 hypothetical protein Pmar_PMAR022109 [Perkinsus marinus ATCC 50983]
MFDGLMGGLIAIAIIFFIAALIIGWLGWERRRQIKYEEKQLPEKSFIDEEASHASENEPQNKPTNITA